MSTVSTARPASSIKSVRRASPMPADTPGVAARPALMRETSRADLRALAQLFRDTYHHATHPCANEAYLGQLIDTDRIRCVVAVDEGRIVGCITANRLRASGVVEIGSLVVRPDCRLQRIGQQLSDEIVRLVMADTRCDIVVAFVRSPGTYRLSTRIALSMRAAGHDGGMNVVCGMREHHVLAMASNPGATIRRVRPLVSPPGIERMLSRQAGIESVTGRPPVRWTVPSLWERVDRDTDPACVELDCPPPGGTTRMALRYLLQESNRFAHVDHQHVFVLAERIELIDGLARRGFESTAYLPAWFADGPLRRDCVLMVKRHPVACASLNGFEAPVKAWNRRLRRMREGIRRIFGLPGDPPAAVVADDVIGTAMAA